MTSGPMTMHDQIHPDDERLAALAGSDPEAAGDAALSAHVRDCARCSTIVRELQLMQAALRELPDLLPSRPLQRIPAVPDARPARRWLRRIFAPALVTGTGLVLVGAIGLLGSGAAGTPSVANFDRSLTGGEAASSPEGDAFGGPQAPVTASASEAPTNDAVDQGAREPFAPNLGMLAVLAGLILIATALALRYVVVPRAG